MTGRPAALSQDHQRAQRLHRRYEWLPDWIWNSALAGFLLAVALSCYLVGAVLHPALMGLLVALEGVAMGAVIRKLAPLSAKSLFDEEREANRAVRDR